MSTVKKMQPLIFALIFLLGSIAAFVWVWMSTEQSGELLAERVQAIENEQVFEGQYIQLTEVVEESADERARLQTFILQDESDTIDLLSQFDEVARAQGITLTTEKLDVAEGPGTYNSLAIEMTLEGTEARVLEMIELLETVPYHGHMPSLTLERTTTDSGVRMLTAHVIVQLTINQYDQ